MEGICPCGGRIRERSHFVTTQTGLAVWKHHAPKDLELRLPVKVIQSECVSCGRNHIKIQQNA
jgi:hypothetical protein